MVAITFLKKLYAFFSVICYSGTGIIFIDEYVVDGTVKDVLDVNPIAQHIILYLLIVFWLIKIAWFIFEKFHIERKERMLKMENDQEDLNYKRRKHNDK